MWIAVGGAVGNVPIQELERRMRIPADTDASPVIVDGSP